MQTLLVCLDILHINLHILSYLYKQNIHNFILIITHNIALTCKHVPQEEFQTLKINWLKMTSKQISHHPPQSPAKRNPLLLANNSSSRISPTLAPSSPRNQILLQLPPVQGTSYYWLITPVPGSTKGTSSNSN